MSEQAAPTTSAWDCPSWKAAAVEYHANRKHKPIPSKAAPLIDREYVLAELRCTSLRARTAVADLDAIGIALKGGAITPEQALAYIDDADAFRYLDGGGL